MGRHHKQPKRSYITRTFKECMTEALAPVWDEEVVQPVQRVVHWTTTRKFGDDALKPRAVVPKVMLRFLVALPVGAVGVVLCASIIGLPLGIPIMLAVGAFISKPIRQHPAFNPDDPKNRSTIDEYEAAE